MQYCGAAPRAGSTTAAGGRSTTLHSRKRTRQAARCWENPCTRWLWSLVDAMHRKGPQHQARLGRCIGRWRRSPPPTGDAVPLIILTANSSFAPTRPRSAGARSKTPSLMFATSSSVAGDGSIAVVAIQQIPERLVDAQRAGNIAFFGMRPHQIATGMFVGRIEIDDRGRNLLFGVDGNVGADQAGFRDFASAVHGWSDAWPAPRPGTTDRDRPFLRATARQAAAYRAAADGRARFRPAGCTLSMSTSTCPMSMPIMSRSATKPR